MSEKSIALLEGVGKTYRNGPEELHIIRGVDLEVAAAGNTEGMRAKVKTMRALGLNDVIEDILITLGKQYHILRPSARKDGVFVYFVLDKQRANLAMARRKVQDVDKEMNF